jgi:flagellar assembly protein FliH
MSSILVPKEQLSAYQRWEMASFEEKQTTSVQIVAPPLIALPTADDVATVLENARLEGYAAGLEEGRVTGLAETKIALKEALLPLQELAESFNEALRTADEAIAQDALDLALDLAKAMLKNALSVQPELILPIVKEAIHYLPSLKQPAILTLHPADAAIVIEQIGEDLTKSGWRIAGDMQVERGGCRVETASNQIDASATTRWLRIAESLGKQSDWLSA